MKSRTPKRARAVAIQLSRAFIATALLLAAATVAACRAEHTKPGLAPATYAGVVPCADCPGIKLQVALGSDSTFRLQQIYIGRDTSKKFIQQGRWRLDSDKHTITLLPSSGSSQQFRVVTVNQLRMLDVSGHEIGHNMPDTLNRVAPVDTAG